MKKMSDEEVQEFLIKTKEKLEKQDNRGTADPIWVVYDLEKVRTTEGYTDEWEYADFEDGYTRIGETKEALIAYMHDNLDTRDGYVIPSEEDIQDMDADELLKWLQDNNDLCKDFWHKWYFKKVRKFIGVFFTEEAADNFIKANSYHYTKEVHTYVDCLWRNYEMQTIRNLLLEGRFIKNEAKK